MIHVLNLSLWYPHRKDQMSGLFVRKHALAVSNYCKVTVLYLKPDVCYDQIEIVHQKTGNVNEVYVYTPDRETGFFKYVFKLFYFLLGYHLGFDAVLKFYGKPDIVQANILTRTAFMALFIKIRHRIPYIIFEHWSRYLSGNQAFYNKFHKQLTQICVKYSSAVLSVSNLLIEGMKNNDLNHPNFYRVNNVVDDFFFEKPDNTPSNEIQFLNITCFDEKSKNLKGLIRAASKLALENSNFKLILAGTGVDYKNTVEYSEEFPELKDKIQFTGELNPVNIKEKIDDCSCVVQFSNYETAGVVVAEAMACGKYIITSKVGIASEYIHSNYGKLITPGNEEELYLSMKDVIEKGPYSYNQECSRDAFENFSFVKVGKQITEIYKSVLRK